MVETFCNAAASSGCHVVVWLSHVHYINSCVSLHIHHIEFVPRTFHICELLHSRRFGKSLIFFFISSERPRIVRYDFPCTYIVFILCRLLKLREIAKRKKTHCIQKQAVWSSEVGQMGKNLHEYSFTFTLQTSLYYEVTVPCKVECMNSWGTFGLLLVVSNWLPQFYPASS